MINLLIAINLDVSWSIQFYLFQRSEDDSSKIINFEKTSRFDESYSKTRDDSKV